MPGLTTSGPALALILLGFSGGDPAAVAPMTNLANAFAAWLVTNAIVTNIPPDGTMIAAGAAVTGVGQIDFASDGNDFGDHLAASIPAIDLAGIAKWRAIGSAVVAHIKSHGQVNPASFVAVPTGGAVTGTGTLSFSTSVFSPTLASVLSLVDVANQAVWLAIGSALLLHITTNTIINTLGFTSPTGGGPLVGVSIIG